MKHTDIYRIIGAALILLTAAPLFSCHTTEANYKAAYEKAVERSREGLDSTIYTQIRREARPATAIIDGDTVGLKREYVKVTADQRLTNADMKCYNVVVAQFKQLFHARSMSSRLADKGYPGAMVLETAEPLYYVVAESTDSLRRALNTLSALEKNPPLRLNDGFPWLLRPANR